jgi:hypothetical protein
MEIPPRDPDPESRAMAKKRLLFDGFALIREHELGIDPGHRAHVRAAFFNDTVLRRYPDDIPQDRKRARDVVRYDRHNGEVALAEYPTIAIDNRGEHAGRRDFHRTPVLGDPVIRHWIGAVLHLIPERDQQDSGTFGVNFFRTFTNVVTKPHQDAEQYVIIYVIDKTGRGGRTQLFTLDRKPVFEEELHPGDLIVFRDKDFLHNATPLEGSVHRDALVCTVNYPQTYPLA